MCLGAWSLLGYVKDIDVKAVTVLPDLKDDEEEEPLADDWDLIIQYIVILVLSDTTVLTRCKLVPVVPLTRTRQYPYPYFMGKGLRG